MSNLARLGLGIAATYGFIWLSVEAYGFVVIFPTSNYLWKNYPMAVHIGHEAIAFLPFVILAGLFLERVFPVHAFPFSLASTVAALAFVFAPLAAESLDVALSGLSLLSEFVVMFVVGVPLIVFGVRRWRTNLAFNRTSRKRAAG